MVTLNVYVNIEPMSKIQNMLLVSPSLWRGYLGLRVDPGPHIPAEDPRGD